MGEAWTNQLYAVGNRRSTEPQSANDAYVGSWIVQEWAPLRWLTPYVPIGVASTLRDVASTSGRAKYRAAAPSNLAMHYRQVCVPLYQNVALNFEPGKLEHVHPRVFVAKDPVIVAF
jgi:hypothetical protein